MRPDAGPGWFLTGVALGPMGAVGPPASIAARVH